MAASISSEEKNLLSALISRRGGNVCHSFLKISVFLGVLVSMLFARAVAAQSTELNLADIPLFVEGSRTNLLQMVLQRDNRLFAEAYPSHEDINNDGILDNTYKPDEIDYYGYFDSHFCYQQLATHLEPVGKTTDKKCFGLWSGDWLNYATMTRMDVLLAALYGGRRLIDTPTETRLRRAFVTWDAVTWGVEYTSVAVNGYNISNYTPYSLPASGTRHLFSTNNYQQNDVPWLRVRLDDTQVIYDWIDKEKIQGDGPADFNIQLDVTVCKDGFLEEFCRRYPSGSIKPTGLLHEFGENDSLYFGLVTGSYNNNLRGGVVRRNIGSFGSQEVNPDDGTYLPVEGIVNTLNKIRIPNDFVNQSGFRSARMRDCQDVTLRLLMNGECAAWGNPIAEMMYEGLRYFSGSQQPTAAFSAAGEDPALGLSTAVWDNPYDESKPYGQCSGAYQLVISDPNPTYDSDDLPGSDFGLSPFTGSTLGTMHVGNIADFISSNESSVAGLKFIGESGAVIDRTPAPKTVTSLRNIRGLGPDDTHRQGSYYSSSVAYYGNTSDINPIAPEAQTVKNITLALGDARPSIDVQVGDQQINFVPYSRTVGSTNIGSLAFKAVNAMVGFTVISVSPTEGEFRVSFEDREVGSDNDLDASAFYKYTVVGGQVQMEVTADSAVGSAVQHLGFVVSGSTEDGVYLVIRDLDTTVGQDFDFFQDVPPGKLPGEVPFDGVALPLQSTFTFTPSGAPAAEVLPSPLWFAAKWGGFEDANEDGIPQTDEWDADLDGIPDNFFQVSNPAEMLSTLRAIFQRISEQTGTITSVASTSGALRTGDKVYRSEFLSGAWTGDVLSHSISLAGEVAAVPDWSAKQALNNQINNGSRDIITYNPEADRGVPFQWPANHVSPATDEISVAQVSALSTNANTRTHDGRGEDRVSYIRGQDIEGFRVRVDFLGDIVNSSPALVGAPAYAFPDIWGEFAPENSVPYSSFAATHRQRRRVVYIGANDGMLHAFDAGEWQGTEYSAGTGSELFAYIPSPVFRNLSGLTSPNYLYKPFVDLTPRASDVFINGQWRTVLIGGLRGGGQGIYALDVTDPDSISESTAEQAVLWEFTDEHDPSVGFTFSSPIIARMANGKWAAIMSNGYNNAAVDVGYQQGGGGSSILIIDIESGNLIRKLLPEDLSCQQNTVLANGPTEPTAVDLDGDRTVDRIYAGDLNGCVYAFDVSDSNPSHWTDGELKHEAVDDLNVRTPITTPIVVGSHPTGEGVMLYFGTGKYLEPSDQMPNASRDRFYAVWDSDTFDASTRSRISGGDMVAQSILSVGNQDIDTDGDGTTDQTVQVRMTSEHTIDWNTDAGWYLDLEYDSLDRGEQVVAAPVLRDGKIYISTHIPSGDECSPEQNGWLMILDARSGAMLADSQIDLDGDGERDDGIFGGINGISNSHASPTIIAAENADILLTQTATDTDITSAVVHTRFREGRLSWRELEP